MRYEFKRRKTRPKSSAAGDKLYAINNSFYICTQQLRNCYYLETSTAAGNCYYLGAATAWELLLHVNG